jgi:hypothetical protein
MGGVDARNGHDSWELRVYQGADPETGRQRWHNIRGSATLFRRGFASDLVQATFFLFTAFALYFAAAARERGPGAQG